MMREKRLNFLCPAGHICLLAWVLVSRPFFLSCSHLASVQILLLHHQGLLFLLEPLLPRVVVVVVFLHLPLKPQVTDLTPSPFPSPAVLTAPLEP